LVKKNDNNWARRVVYIIVGGSRPQEKIRKTLIYIEEENMRVEGLVREDAYDSEKWRRLSWCFQVVVNNC